ncbi:MAG: hypothetical protein ABI886_15740 [Betaproteobacteria bacterium]
MNTFNKKSLYAALAGLSALGATGAAQAVSVNLDGLGQVLLYPYYTVRTNAAGNAYQSLISVVNTGNSARAVKVRFLEGKNSREVLDFNLFLSKNDVWVADVIPTADGAGIFTPDKSCTVPVVSANPASPTPFVNYAYTGSTNDDGGDKTLDRTREGYVEIISMADIFTGTPTYTTITHALGATPGTPDCDLDILQSPSLSKLNPQLASDIGPIDSPYVMQPGLFGGITLINVGSGVDIATEAVALDAFFTLGGQNLMQPEGSIQPNLAKVSPKTSVVTSGSTTYVTDWSATTNAVDAVSAVLMRNNVYNEFVLDAATQSQTDWVVTFPTKWAYYGGGQILDTAGAVIGVAVTKLFQRNFSGTKGACDDVVISRYDREEKTVKSATTFSPPPPTATDSICWEANVVTFNNGNILGSKNLANIPTTFENGWVGINFPVTTNVPPRHQLVGGNSTTFDTASGSTSSINPTTYNGLPVIGFAASTYKNGFVAAGSTVYYAGRQNHRFTRSILGLIN